MLDTVTMSLTLNVREKQLQSTQQYCVERLLTFQPEPASSIKTFPNNQMGHRQ